MKSTIGLILLIIFVVGCQTSKIENIEFIQPKIDTTPTPKIEIPELTKEQKKKLVENLSNEAINILENAKEFELEGGNGSSNFTPIGRTKINDKTLMNNLIKALYQDIVTQSGMAACFKPRHGLKAEFNGKSLRLIICYECSYLKGYVSDKEFISSIDSKFSKALFDTILEKSEKIK